MTAYSFRLKAVLAAGLVAAADLLLFDHEIGANLSLLMLAALAVAVGAQPESRRDRRALAAFAVAGGFSLLLIDRPGLIAWFMAVLALGVAVLSPRADGRSDVADWALRLLRAGLMSVPAPVLDIRRAAARGGRPGAVRRALVAAALPVLGGAVFLSLFVLANPVMEAALAAWRLPPFSLGRLLFWIWMATAAWALLRPRGARRRFTPTWRSREPGKASASVAISLVVFNGLFALQNGLDLAFLWSGAPLPEGVSFAEYAHRGAYLLIVTALLAGAFVLVFLRPGAAQSRAVRWLVIAWVGQNLMLVASSALRTLDYVAAYGLTQLRISALIWMALVALGLVLICVRLVRDKSASWLVGANAAALAVVLSAVAIADIGAVAAAWNVRHAREVTGDLRDPSLDVVHLRELGPAALVPLTELAGRPLAPTLAAEVHAAQQATRAELAARQAHWRTWTWRGQRRLDAAAALTAPAQAGT